MAGKISGVVLAGGAGSRFDGRIKPKIIIDGEPIISRIISVIKDIFDEIIIVTSNPEEFSDFSFCKIVGDEIPGAGPLGGIHAAMKTSSNDAIFVFAGDMPFLDKGIIMRLIETYNNSDCDALIPWIEEYIEPLHSIYSSSLTEHLEGYLGNGRGNAVRDYIKSLNVRYIKFDNSEKTKKTFTNINSASDIYPSEGTGGTGLP
jgi:molybdopterin-guanine dinucleotide biosynthesis protein A